MMLENDLKVQVRQIVIEVKNRLSTAKDPCEICRELQRLIWLLPQGTDHKLQGSRRQSPDLTRSSSSLKADSTKLTRDSPGLTGDDSRLTEDVTDITKLGDTSMIATDATGLISNSSTAITKVKTATSRLTTDSSSLITNLPEVADDSTKLKPSLTHLNSVKPSLTELKTSSSDFSDSDLARAQIEFCTQHYVRFLECLVSLLSLDWCGRFEPYQRREYLDVFFLNGVPQDAFLVLSSAIIHSSPSFKQNKCISLLEDFLTHRCISCMVWTQCVTMLSGESEASRAQVARQGIQWDQLINMLVTLPDRMANQMKEKCRELFYPKQYFGQLGKEILIVLHKVYAQLTATKDCSLVFVSQLIGRVCLSGHADTLFQVLLPHFAKLTHDDFIWSRICTRLVAGAPERSLESMLHCLVQQIPWYGVMSRLLGDAVLSNKQLEYLLTNKFLLHRCYQQNIVPQNILGYLADSPNRRYLLIKTLKTVLDVWGDGSAVKHTSYDQQVYLTKTIFICIGHLSEKEKKENKSDLMYKLMPGVQSHINSAIIKVRRLGMMVAETMTKTLEPDGPKLSFEYQKDEESEKMLSLLMPPEDPGIQSLTKDIEDISIDTAEMSSLAMETADSNGDMESIVKDEELDSDDDLEPYDMTYDPKVTQVKTPMYIRDCMEGLMSKDNPDLFETSLKVCDKLIQAKPDDLQDVCVEFAKILLHLDNSYDTDNYASLRHNSMVSLAVQCPVQVAQYLTAEFYDRNYSIRHRLDVLEVLAAAAQELSQPTEATPSNAPNRTSKTMPPLPMDLPGVETWRDIVQKRIESKTRRFVKGSTKPLPVPVANRFAPVAGYFFFPLMKQYDSKLNTMDMLGEDYLLLGRTMYTLGVVIHAAQNTTVCRQMASALLEFIWVLRYHTEPFVRQALLFSVSMVILSVPPHLLVSDLQDDLLECKLWIEDIVEKDPDSECKRLAAQTLVLMQSSVQKELNLQTDDKM